MSQKEAFMSFVQNCSGFEERTRMRLFLVGLGTKSATYAKLKITPKNLEDKVYFESHLHKLGLRFEVFGPKGFEEITNVSKGTITWKMSGTWYGYDIFKSSKEHVLFKKYVAHMHRNNHNKADRIAAKVYGYPPCCATRFIKEQDMMYLKKHYSYLAYFREREQKALRFPFVLHTPCSTTCSKTHMLNAKYSAALHHAVPKWLGVFSKRTSFKTDVIVDSQSDIYTDIDSQESIWLEKDGHHYQCISLNRIKTLENHFVALTHLQKNSLERGTIARATIMLQHSYPIVKIEKIVNFWSEIHHERRFHTNNF